MDDDEEIECDRRKAHERYWRYRIRDGINAGQPDEPEASDEEE